MINQRFLLPDRVDLDLESAELHLKTNLLALSDNILLLSFIHHRFSPKNPYHTLLTLPHFSTHRYQFNPPLARDEPITNILVKALTVFPSPDFSLCLHLLPPHILSPLSTSSSLPAAGDAPLSEAVQKLATLNTLLSSASYAKFWSTLDSDDLYADLIADVSGFEELMRVRIAVTVGQSMRSVQRGVLESWLNLQGQEFEHFVGEVCGWGVDDSEAKGKTAVVRIPINKENEAKGTVVRENVHFERKFCLRLLRCVVGSGFWEL